jgi:NAD(P)H-dependent FMN reductase
MRVLGISGSLRDSSHKTALLRAAQQGAPEGVPNEAAEQPPVTA